MEKYQHILNTVSQGFANAEEDCVKQILRNLLKREPTIEDAKECDLLHIEGEIDRYGLAYKGMYLGKIVRNFPDYNSNSHSFGVTFIPAEEKDFLEPFKKNGKLNVNL